MHREEKKKKKDFNHESSESTRIRKRIRKKRWSTNWPFVALIAVVNSSLSPVGRFLTNWH